MGRPKLTDEERKRRKSEYMKKYNAAVRAKKKAEKAKIITDTDNQTPRTEAEIAALVNAYHGYSAIVAESRHGNRIVIAERMISASLLVFGDGNGSYRVKDTRYHNFSSRAAALQWMRDNGCRGLKEY